ncbi:MAG TPA: HEPN domain-containing protein [Vicinamibacterales bacterium]|nr:HEPN domain-containing protein [Vicinamibacterales bacterium]
MTPRAGRARRGERRTDEGGCGFLAEQSAQLAVKALLHGVGAGAWGHDLVRLGEALTEATGQAPPPPVEAALRRLSRHYIATRHPDAHASGPPDVHYGPEDAAQALSDLDEILAFVDEIWRQVSAAADAPDDGA